MHTFLGFLVLYAFLLGLYRLFDQVRSLFRWLLDRVLHR